MNFEVVERNQTDMDTETEILYNKVKPYLDDGLSVYNAVLRVYGVRYINTNTSWFKRLKERVNNG